MIDRRGYFLRVVEDYNYDLHPYERRKHATFEVCAIKTTDKDFIGGFPWESACHKLHQNHGWELADKPDAPVCEKCLWRIAYDSQLPLNARLARQKDGGSSYWENWTEWRFRHATI